MKDNILEIKNMTSSFIMHIDGSTKRVINDISFSLERGKILGLVGESGSGKSVATSSILRLTGKNAVITGEILFNGVNLVDLSEKEIRELRGGKISMVFQDPMTSLNPVYTIGNQLIERIKLHRDDIKNPKAYAIELLETVGISEGEKRLKQYPHELSGGMRQRIAIALALSSNPELLIADEPTTALDVTVQAQILALIKKLTAERNMSTILITHDLGIVAGMCDNIVVLYGGRICESGTAVDIFKNAKHEYTKGLIGAVPGTEPGKRPVPIEGNPVSRKLLPDGCLFCTRCKKAMKICLMSYPPKREFSDEHIAYCWLNEVPNGE